MSISLIDLINRSGDRIQSQFLTGSFLRMVRRKKDSEITFVTSHEMASDVAKAAFGISDAPKFIGIVVWIPADVLKAARKEVKS